MIWSGSLNLGDTPGVFNDASFAGLLLQIPVTITYIQDEAKEPVRFLLETTEVEIFGEKRHAVYWDWTPGQVFPGPVGFIDDTDQVPGKPEFHILEIPAEQAGTGQHSITIVVNPEVPAGLRDDFVLRRIEAHESVGAKVGW